MEHHSEPKKNGEAGKKSKKKRKALLLGLGLDSEDGHVRITRGPNFHLVGGSKDTHEAMQETAVKFNEELHRRGRRLGQISANEFADIMHKLK